MRFASLGRDIALFLVLVGLAAVVTWQPWRDMFRIATSDGSSSHALAVPFLAAWLAWVRRRAIAAAPRRRHWVGPVLILLGIGLYLASYPLRADTFWYASPIVMVIGAFATVWGTGVVYASLPAMLLLFFMVPVPAIANHIISVPLQTVSAIATVEVLNTFGVGVKRFGNLLTINEHSVNVAEACSGLRSTFALLLLVYVFCFVQRLRWSLRIGLLGAAPLIAIICNICRLIPVTLAYGYGKPNLADALHDWLGFVTFAVAVVLCGTVEVALRWAGVRVLQRPRAGGGLARAATGSPCFARAESAGSRGHAKAAAARLVQRRPGDLPQRRGPGRDELLHALPRRGGRGGFVSRPRPRRDRTHPDAAAVFEVKRFAVIFGVGCRCCFGISCIPGSRLPGCEPSC